MLNSGYDVSPRHKLMVMSLIAQSEITPMSKPYCPFVIRVVSMGQYVTIPRIKMSCKDITRCLTYEIISYLFCLAAVHPIFPLQLSSPRRVPLLTSQGEKWEIIQIIFYCRYKQLLCITLTHYPLNQTWHQTVVYTYSRQQTSKVRVMWPTGVVKIAQLLES